LDRRHPQLELIPLRVEPQQLQGFGRGGTLGRARRHPPDRNLLRTHQDEPIPLFGNAEAVTIPGGGNHVRAA